MLLVDGSHRNDFTREEITILVSRVADRGYSIEFVGAPTALGSLRGREMEERLRQADSFAVINPKGSFINAEVDIVERFVGKGGKLLLLADPTREHEINSLAKRFGIAFQPDYLYNVVEHDLSFRDIFVGDFRPDVITRGLRRVALYTAGSISSSGTPLAFTDDNTRSSMTDRAGSYHPLVKGVQDNVLGVSDLTFMIPPQNSIMDNDRLISNIADFLTTSDRTFGLADFPHFFKSDVDVLLGQASLIDEATRLKNLLLTFQSSAEITGVEDLTKDTIYLGLYDDSQDVVQYLSRAGIQVDGTLRTPFTTNIVTERTGIMLLHRTERRHVLVILGDSQRSLTDLIGRLGRGTFRRGLVDDLMGVYEF